ncbi:MAG: type II 3-dehydroquinate dehydratase [Bacteroidales bacterium]|nr:type II 3-dehydroquinate dehydratase [Bacteroidales bacterium]MBQ3843516.1 type II 3-dehydroquinate dehydratase [Bacteroidales bacterium]
MRILVLNGPNLNLIGKREPEIYGNQSLEDYLTTMRERFPDCEIDSFQTNHEGVLIDKLHEAMGKYDGVVMNPGGYAHTSIALADAVRSIGIPVVEVHISNIYEREEYRHHSFTAEAAVHAIVGHGLEGYAEAVNYLTKLL